MDRSTEPSDPLDALLQFASDTRPPRRFAADVVDESYGAQQVNCRPHPVFQIAVPLAAAAVIALLFSFLGFAGTTTDSVAAEESILEIVPEAGGTIEEIDAIDVLIALETSEDISLIGDEDLESFLF